MCGGADGLSVMVPADEAAGRDTGGGGGGVGKCQSFFGHKPDILHEKQLRFCLKLTASFKDVPLQRAVP